MFTLAELELLGEIVEHHSERYCFGAVGVPEVDRKVRKMGYFTQVEALRKKVVNAIRQKITERRNHE